MLRTESKWFDRGSAAFVLVTAALLCVTWLRARDRRSSPLVLAGVLLFLVFLVLPDNIFGSGFADARLVAPALMLLLIGLPAPQSFDRPFLIVAIAFFVLRIAYVSEAWARRSANLEREVAVLDQVPYGSRIAAFAHPSGCDEWPFSALDALPSLAIPRKAAFVNTEWDMPGALLMEPIYNANRDFNDVTSSQTSKAGTKCVGEPLDRRIAALPRERFDFVWSFAGPSKASGLSLIARGPRGFLYRIERSTGDPGT